MVPPMNKALGQSVIVENRPGAAQALAFAAGGLVAGGSVDLMRAWTGSPAAAYVTVFALDALLFVAAANWAWRLGGVRRAQVRTTLAQRMGSHA